MTPYLDEVVPVSTEEYAEELVAQGYRRISWKHCLAARIDREDWQKYMLESGCVNPLTLLNGGQDTYRSSFTKDRITVSDDVTKLIPTSCHDKVGYIKDGVEYPTMAVVLMPADANEEHW